MNLPPLYKTIINTENIRNNIISTINTSSTLCNNYNSVDQDVSLECLRSEIIPNLISWTPALQICRSNHNVNNAEDGKFNYLSNTAITINAFNGELSSSFFSVDDIKNSYFGTDLNTSTGVLADNTPLATFPIYSIYNKTNSKGGILFKTASTKTYKHVYYQFTFPYDCYIYVSICAQTAFVDVEAQNSPVAFMITNDTGTTVIARTTCDDGNGNFSSTANKQHAILYWHGHVKKNWKFYYAQQTTNKITKPGFNIVVFKIDKTLKTIKGIKDSVTLLSVKKTGNSKFVQSSSVMFDTDIKLETSNNNEANNIIDFSNSHLYPFSKTVIPNLPIFSDTKNLFYSPNSDITTQGIYWLTLNIPYDCFIDLSLFGYSTAIHNNKPSIEQDCPYGFIIENAGNKSTYITKTSYDNNRYFSNIYYNGLVKKDSKIYLAYNDIANNRCRNSGLLLNIIKKPTIQPISIKFTRNSDGTGNFYTSITDTTTVLSNIFVSQNTVANNILQATTWAGGNFPSRAIFTEYTVDNSYIAVIMVTSISCNGSGHTARSICVITDASGKNIKSIFYPITTSSSGSNINRNGTLTFKAIVSRNDKIYMFISHVTDNCDGTNTDSACVLVTLLPSYANII